MLQTVLSNRYAKRIYDLISKKSLGEIVRYILVSIGGYLSVLLSMYIFVDLLKSNKSLSYFGIYLFAYLFDYLLTLKYVFQKEHKHSSLLKYVIYLVVFFLLNNLLYNLMIYLNVHYLISTITVMAILFPLRFSTIKYVIFK